MICFLRGEREERLRILNKVKAFFLTPGNEAETSSLDWLLLAKNEFELDQFEEARQSLQKAKRNIGMFVVQTPSFFLEIVEIEHKMNPQWALETLNKMKAHLSASDEAVDEVLQALAKIAQVESRLHSGGLEQTLGQATPLLAQSSEQLDLFLDQTYAQINAQFEITIAKGAFTQILALVDIPKAKSVAPQISDIGHYKSLAFLAIVEQEMKSDPKGALKTANLISDPFYREWARLKISAYSK